MGQHAKYESNAVKETPTNKYTENLQNISDYQQHTNKYQGSLFP